MNNDNILEHEDAARMPPVSEARKLVLQVHLNEYQALMARNTSSMHWQWLLIPAAVVFLSLTANVWDRIDHRLLVWGATMAIQTAIVLANKLGWDQYNNIVYIETDLRLRIQEILGRGLQGSRGVSFWGYELYLMHQRGDHPLWWECTSASLAPILIVLAVVTSYPFTPWDWCGLVLNLLLLAFLVYKTLSMVKLRWKWCESLREHVTHVTRNVGVPEVDKRRNNEETNMRHTCLWRMLFGLASVGLMGLLIGAVFLCRSLPQLAGNEWLRWVAGMVGLSVILGIPVSFLWKGLARKALSLETGAIVSTDDQTGWFTGLIERLFFTLAIGANLSGAVTGMILWTTVKHYVFWGGARDPKEDRERWPGSALGSLGSMAIAIAGGLVCRGSVQ